MEVNIKDLLNYIEEPYDYVVQYINFPRYNDLKDEIIKNIYRCFEFDCKSDNIYEAANYLRDSKDSNARSVYASIVMKIKTQEAMEILHECLDSAFANWTIYCYLANKTKQKDIDVYLLKAVELGSVPAIKYVSCSKRVDKKSLIGDLISTIKVKSFRLEIEMLYTKDYKKYEDSYLDEIKKGSMKSYNYLLKLYLQTDKDKLVEFIFNNIDKLYHNGDLYTIIIVHTAIKLGRSIDEYKIKKIDKDEYLLDKDIINSYNFYLRGNPEAIKKIAEAMYKSTIQYLFRNELCYV
jgi:hypothetical protein